MPCVFLSMSQWRSNICVCINIIVCTNACRIKKRKQTHENNLSAYINTNLKFSLTRRSERQKCLQGIWSYSSLGFTSIGTPLQKDKNRLWVLKKVKHVTLGVRLIEVYLVWGTGKSQTSKHFWKHSLPFKFSNILSDRICSYFYSHNKGLIGCFFYCFSDKNIEAHICVVVL